MNYSAADELVAGAASFGISLTAEQQRQFLEYARLLEEWNARMDLTAVAPSDFIALHFIDSLSVARAFDPSAARSLLDVGSGAGFPGLALKIAFPHLAVTLLEASAKRCGFLQRVVDALDLRRVALLRGRAEELAHDEGQREAYCVVTARAVARLRILAELTLPFARLNGVVIAQKSGDVAGELKEAAPAVNLLGGTVEDTVTVTVPPQGVSRQLVVFRKQVHTPGGYPRPFGKIKRRNLF